jgi:hypothetical protein
LSENLNAVSNDTRDFIHKAQLRYILRTPDLMEFDWTGPAQKPSADRFPDIRILWQ